MPTFAWWKLNDGSGTSAADASGNARNATLTNAPTWITGLGGSGALQFNGTNQSAATGNVSFTGGVISVSLWAKRNWATNNKYCPFFVHNYGAGQGIGFYVTGGAFQDWTQGALILVGNGYNSGVAPRVLAQFPAFADGTWLHIVGVLGPNNNDLYVNGVRLIPFHSATASVPNITTQPMGFGGNTGTSDFGDHAEDDIRIFTSALTASQVYGLFLAGPV